MARVWRWVAPVAAAGGLIAGTAMLAIATSASAAPRLPAVDVTIAATSPHYPGAVNGKIDGYAVAVYNDTSNMVNTGVVSGQVTGANGDMATLLAEPFGGKNFTATGLKMKLIGSTARYSFDVVPSVETRYEVQVSASGTVVATSASVAVWVTEIGVVSDKHKKCSPTGRATSCAVFYQVHEMVPASAYSTETSKPFYLYQAVGYLKLPSVFTLSKVATVSEVKKISSGEFEILLTFHIPLKHHEGAWLTTFCTQDTESVDGLGLPGHHGCGRYTIQLTAKYLG